MKLNNYTITSYVNFLKISLIILLVGIHGCSSSSEKTDTEALQEPPEVSDLEALSSDSAKTNTKGDSTAEIISSGNVSKSDTNQELKMNQLDQAIKNQNDDLIVKMSNEAILHNSKDAKALNALAMVNYKRNRLDAAVYFINRAIAVQNDKAYLQSNFGIIKLAQGERREAIKLFRKAIELDSKEGFAAANLGALYIQDKDYNKAYQALDMAFKNGIKDTKTLLNYSVSLTGVGKKDEAVSVYEKLLKDNPNSKEAILNYSVLLIQDLQKYKQGLDLLNRLKFVGEPSDSRELIKDLENKAKAGLQ